MSGTHRTTNSAETQAGTPARTRARGRRIARRTGAAAAVLALNFALAACGDAEQAQEPSATQTASNGEVFNDTDVDFATTMIPHHAQAVEMALIAQERDLSPQVAQLASAIRDAQVPEVELMVDLLTAWGQPVPETSMDHANAGHDTPSDESSDESASGHDGHDMGSDGSTETDSDMGSMAGMMSAEDMEALEAAPGAKFERMWLEMMIEHHTGAIEMAQTEQDAGANSEAIELAETIEADQKQEITQMEQLLD